jgi:hypothetical protein
MNKSIMETVDHKAVKEAWNAAISDGSITPFELGRQFAHPTRRTTESEEMVLPFRAVDGPFWLREPGRFDADIPDEALSAVTRIQPDGSVQGVSDGRPAVVRVGDVAPGAQVFLTERIEDAHALNLATRAPVFVVPTADDIPKVAKAIAEADPSLGITVFSTSLQPGAAPEGVSVFDLPRWLEDMSLPPGTSPHGVAGAFGDRLAQQLVSDALQVKPEVIWSSPWSDGTGENATRSVIGRRGDHLFAGTQEIRAGKENGVVWAMEPRHTSIESAHEQAQRLLEGARQATNERKEASPQQADLGGIAPNERIDVPVAKLDELLADLKKSFIVAGSNFYLRDDKKMLAFVDDGGFIRTTHENSEIIKRMLDLAEAKGWSSVHLAGSDEFRRKAWIEAQLKGLQTTGYEPDAWDQEQLQKRTAVMKGANSVGDSRLVQEPAQRTAPVEAPTVSDASPEAQPTTAPNVVNINKARTERYAKPVTALLKMVGAAEQDIEVTLDSLARTIDPKRAYVGELLEHGAAPYKFDSKQAPNYFIKLKLNDGSEQTLWGVDFPRALSEANSGMPEPGDYVLVGFEGSKSVRLPNPQKDGEWMDSRRNQWLAERVRDLPIRMRKQPTQTQDQSITPTPAPETMQSGQLADNVAQLLRSKGANEQAVGAAMTSFNRTLAGVSPLPTPVSPSLAPAAPLSPSL